MQVTTDIHDDARGQNTLLDTTVRSMLSLCCEENA